MTKLGVIVPFRGLDTCKSRLRAALPAAEVEAISARMLRHVVDTCRTALPVAPILLVTRAAEAAPALDHAEVRILALALDLNAAIDAGRAVLADLGAERVLVVAADLPRLTVGDVRTLAACSCDVAIAPDHHHRGTNALVMPARATVLAQFGADSARRHSDLAAARGFSVEHIHSEGLARDVDTPADLAGQGDVFFTHRQANP